MEYATDLSASLPEPRIHTTVRDTEGLVVRLNSDRSSFDQIAFAIEREIARPLDEAIGLGRNDRFDASLLQGKDQAISIMGLISEEGLRIDIFQERLCLAEIRGLAGSQREGDRIAQGIDKGVDFGGQSTSRSSDRLVAAVFFRAPALCW